MTDAIQPLGNQAALVSCPEEQAALGFAERARHLPAPRLLDVVQACTTVAVFFDLDQTHFAAAGLTVGLLIRELDGRGTLKNKAMDALGKLKDERGLEAVAQQLAGFNEARKASSVLITVGQPAEPVLIRMLQHENAKIVREACRILGQIGTKASLDALTRATTHKDKNVAAAAKQAIADINRK